MKQAGHSFHRPCPRGSDLAWSPSVSPVSLFCVRSKNFQVIPPTNEHKKCQHRAGGGGGGGGERSECLAEKSARSGDGTKPSLSYPPPSKKEEEKNHTSFSGLGRCVTSPTRKKVSRLLWVSVRVCVCVCIYIKLRITAQSDPVILVILCH